MGCDIMDTLTFSGGIAECHVRGHMAGIEPGSTLQVPHLQLMGTQKTQQHSPGALQQPACHQVSFCHKRRNSRSCNWTSNTLILPLGAARAWCSCERGNRVTPRWPLTITDDHLRDAHSLNSNQVNFAYRQITGPATSPTCHLAASPLSTEALWDLEALDTLVARVQVSCMKRVPLVVYYGRNVAAVWCSYVAAVCHGSSPWRLWSQRFLNQLQRRFIE